MPPEKILNIALVDDHRLFRKGVINLLQQIFPDCIINFEADDGLHMQNKISGENLPEIILMDINMPNMDGFAAVKWLNEHFPQVNVLILSMIEIKETIDRMKNLHVKGYLNKDFEPGELKKSINAVLQGKTYFE